MGSYSGSLSPADHFVTIGAARGNKPNASFDPGFYASKYADLSGKGLDAADLLVHYLQFGLDEGRLGSASLLSFNPTAYLAANPDINTYVQANLAQFGGSATNGAIAHYVKFGQIEGRPTAPAAAPVTTLKLTADEDNIAGTSAAETFSAYIVDNQNTLQSGDMVNGGAGTDRLYADIGTSQNFAITAETTGIEEVAIRAQAVAYDTNNNNMVDSGGYLGEDYGNNVQIDAQRMVGVNWWESNNSRADVVIEDVRILASQITKDITIAMVETDPGHVDYGVYFDQYSLRAQTNTASTLTLQLMDTRSNAAGTGPLKDNPYNGVSFEVKAPGATTSKLVTVSSTGIDSALTYTELVAAFNAALAANPDTVNFTAALGGSFTVSDTLGSLQTGTEVVLTVKDGTTVSLGSTSGWTAAGAVPASSGLHTNASTTKSDTTELVTSKIILDDVGRGSTGGDLVVGGLSVGDTSTSKGVQRFEIEVRDNSKLQTINSTNNTLQEVTIKNGVTSSNSFAYVATAKDAGNLTVNGNVGVGVSTPSVDAGNAQNQPLPGSEPQHNSFGFSDVRLIDGSAMIGKLAFTAEVTTASIAKYLNLVDTAPALAPADNISFIYTGGSNADTISVTIDSAVAASQASLTLSAREDFAFTVNGGAGNDTLTVDIAGGNDDSSGSWLVDQRSMGNISIIGGSGDDTIKTPGAGANKIDAGTGNDTVYTDNTGSKAAWVVAAATSDDTSAGTVDLNDLQGLTTSANTAAIQGLDHAAYAGVGSQFLYKGKLTVTFSGASATPAGGVTSGSALAYDNGWESKVDIPTGANYSVSQFHVNQAIKLAINKDAVLSKLLIASDGPSNTLVIKSLIDGAFNASDLEIAITAPSGLDIAAYLPTEQAIVLSAYKAFAANSLKTLVDAETAQDASITAKNAVLGMTDPSVPTNNSVLASTGSDSTHESDNSIKPGEGNDVIVLGTKTLSEEGALSNETIVFAGDIGRDTIVNFDDSTDSVDSASGLDKLDFTSYLSSKTSPSGSTESTVRIATSLNGDTVVEANSVTVLGFTTSVTDTFAGLTASKLLAAVNSTNTGLANYGGFTSGTLDALTTYLTIPDPALNLVGGAGKAVVLVENDENDGEYAVFELAFNGLATNLTADFSSATLVGIIDFGDDVTFATGATGTLV